MTPPETPTPPESLQDLSGYLDACATSPPTEGVVRVMAAAQSSAWANPSSLHGFGLRASELLERSRGRLAELLGASQHDLIFCSGASEAIHLALLGQAGMAPPGRLVISPVEHPATIAAVETLLRQGWEVAKVPVDHRGVIDLVALHELLEPPTRLVSLIWGQSEVGTLQPLETVSRLCRSAGIPLHVDAVQVVGHRLVSADALGVDLLSCTAHKLGGPRGIGLLLRRRGVGLLPQIGGAQEGGLRGGTEAVVLAAGFVQALEEAHERLRSLGGLDPLAALRDPLLARLLELPGVSLSGPAPEDREGRLPHHISLVVTSATGVPLPGRELVRGLWRQGLAVSSGSACSAIASPASRGGGSAVLRALGYPESHCTSGLRISLGPWLCPADLERVPGALEQARRDLEISAPGH
jgi:cysteine desulfurase